MKKIIPFLILTLLVVSNSYAGDYSFRKTKWGMSQKEVLASEKLKPVVQKTEMIIYNYQILNKEVLMAYFFYSR